MRAARAEAARDEIDERPAADETEIDRSAIGAIETGAAALAFALGMLGIAADAAHLLAAALWAGTLLAALAVVVPRMRPYRLRASWRRRKKPG